MKETQLSIFPISRPNHNNLVPFPILDGQILFLEQFLLDKKILLQDCSALGSATYLETLCKSAPASVCETAVK